MSVPADQMPPDTAPNPTGMSEQTPKEGAELIARTNVQTAHVLLQSALAHFPPGSRENKAILEVLKKLSNDFGVSGTAQRLVPAQVMEMVRAVQAQGAAQPPGQTPQ